MMYFYEREFKVNKYKTLTWIISKTDHKSQLLRCIVKVNECDCVQERYLKYQWRCDNRHKKQQMAWQWLRKNRDN
jgi:hypothetical protein